jgi:hypothetical protein
VAVRASAAQGVLGRAAPWRAQVGPLPPGHHGIAGESRSVRSVHRSRVVGAGCSVSVHRYIPQGFGILWSVADRTSHSMGRSLPPVADPECNRRVVSELLARSLAA